MKTMPMQTSLESGEEPSPVKMPKAWAGFAAWAIEAIKPMAATTNGTRVILSMALSCSSENLPAAKAMASAMKAPAPTGASVVRHCQGQFGECRLHCYITSFTLMTEPSALPAGRASSQGLMYRLGCV